MDCAETKNTEFSLVQIVSLRYFQTILWCTLIVCLIALYRVFYRLSIPYNTLQHTLYRVLYRLRIHRICHQKLRIQNSLVQNISLRYSQTILWRTWIVTWIVCLIAFYRVIYRLGIHIVCHEQHTATHCITLQHSATNCKTLQRTATHCNTLQYRVIDRLGILSICHKHTYVCHKHTYICHKHTYICHKHTPLDL